MFPQIWELLILRGGLAFSLIIISQLDYKALLLLHRPVACWIKCRPFHYPSFSEFVSRVTSRSDGVVIIVPVYFLALESCAWYDSFQTRIELSTRSTGGNKTLIKKFPPCCTKIFFFFSIGVLFSARAISDFLRAKSFLFAGLLRGTVSLRTFKIHSQMLLTKVSSATFKMTLR